MKLIKSLMLLIAFVICVPVSGQGLKAFKLKNGLSVWIWEDDSQSDVFGMVGVRAGSVNDPEQYTGLAHYLEHLMFKGTTKIGALNWTEEEPIYKQIIAKYDEMADETDQVKKTAIAQEINELSIQAGKISDQNEFFNLLEGMGGSMVNAGTNYDYTLYFNNFPAYQITKWLEISSQRFIDPVFRTFQSELETVYEEYNRSKDNPARSVNEFLLGKAFEGHPYSRSVIGLGEHLKNPRVSQLIKFYEDWYVPENMVLILVGNVKANDISRSIAATFGRLQAKPVPERKTYPDLEIKGRTQYSAKIGNQPMVAMVYKGVPAGHPDELPLQIAISLLHNSNQTGALDKLSIDGELTYAGASLASLREQGRVIINAVPLYDQNQRRYESNRATERKLLKAIETITKGDYEEWLTDAIKLNMCREFDLTMEDSFEKSRILFSAFVNEEDLGNVLNYKELVMAVTNDDIKRVTAKYLTNDFLALHIDQGKPDKKGKLEKPGYKPIEPPVGQQSLYAQQFKALPMGHVDEKYLDFSEVKTQQINDRSKLLYTQNKENDVFTLIMRYGVGTREFPKLGIAARLMNNAGIMGMYDPQQLKKELSRLNVSYSVNADDDYLTVTMYGYEANLPEACQLLSRQILMPQLDEKQLNRLKGSIIGSRQQRKDNVQILGGALREYIRHQSKSDFIDELTDKEIIELSISELTGDINRASNYESEIFYTGTLPFETVYDVLSNNLPLVANEKPSDSPQPKPFAEITENTIYFLPNNDAEQAQIYFFNVASDYITEDDVVRNAFNQYFSGSFNGLVTQEIREKRSMAYESYGVLQSSVVVGKPTYFTGYIGTQNDKANEAINIFMDLVRNMPENADRMDNIKDYLKQISLSNKPGFRDKPMYVSRMTRLGHSQDPAITNIPKIENLKFEDLVNYYKENVQGKPFVIGIMGNPKSINLDELKKYGKVVRLNERRIFNTKDSFF